jgi:hypothetical protein
MESNTCPESGPARFCNDGPSDNHTVEVLRDPLCRRSDLTRCANHASTDSLMRRLGSEVSGGAFFNDSTVAGHCQLLRIAVPSLGCQRSCLHPLRATARSQV